jgi:hypothetical protein
VINENPEIPEGISFITTILHKPAASLCGNTGNQRRLSDCTMSVFVSKKDLTVGDG